METTNLQALYNADIVEAQPLSREPQTHAYLWWSLAVIEALLFTRLILEFFVTNVTNVFTTAIYDLTYYLMYPVTATLVISNTILLTIVAIIGYFLLTLALAGFLKSRQSPRIRIERARALSRRRYSH